MKDYATFFKTPWVRMQQVSALREFPTDALHARAIPDPEVPTGSALQADVILVMPPEFRREPQPASGARTRIHTYEPVRNEQQVVVDFRLSFDASAATDATRSFIGAQVVQCGPSVAPGEIFHTLKRVLESGEPQETVTRHVQADQEICFYQTATKSGDTVVTTTSIVSIR